MAKLTLGKCRLVVCCVCIGRCTSIIAALCVFCHLSKLQFGRKTAYTGWWRADGGACKMLLFVAEGICRASDGVSEVHFAKSFVKTVYKHNLLWYTLYSYISIYNIRPKFCWHCPGERKTKKQNTRIRIAKNEKRAFSECGIITADDMFGLWWAHQT